MGSSFKRSGFRWISGCSFLLVLVLIANGQTAFAFGPRAPKEKSPSQTPLSMATLGDSITAGAFANYKLDSWKNPLEFMLILRKVLGAYTSGDLQKIEARDLVWGTGDNSRSIVNSHAKRLAALNRSSKKFMAYNGAQSTKTSADVLEEQLEPMFSWSRENLGQGAPDYVAILVGANDLCSPLDESPVTVADYESNVEKIVTQIFEANPQSEVLISEIPNISQLWDRHRDYKISNFRGARTCSELWNQTKFCDNFLRGNEENRAVASRTLQQYNVVLSRVVARRSAEGQKIRFAPGVYDSPIDAKDISVDCFHPSQEGQKQIADVTWQSTAWAHLSP